MGEIAQEIGFHLDEHGCFIPNVEETKPKEEIRKWGKKRLDYLKKYKKFWLDVLTAHGEQFDDAIKKQHEAEEREEILSLEMREKYGLTDDLFQESQAEFRRREKNMQLEIDSIIMEEIICI